jgi:cell division control protein 6
VNELLSGSWVALIGVSNDLHFKESLDPRILSCLSEEELVFRPYMADELYDILLCRAKTSFVDTALPESSIRLCAALAAGEHGDARRALDLLRVAGELAERDSSSQVTEACVRSAQEKIEHDRVNEALRSLPVHSRLIVAAAYVISNHGHEAAVTGDVYHIYNDFCVQTKLEALTQRRISGLINELDAMGILNTRVVSFGRYGRTKKIRLGIPRETVVQTFVEDSLMAPLLSHTPTYLRKGPST